MKMVAKLIQSEEGATAVEYGLILAMVVLAMLAALSQVAGVTVDMWGDVSEAVTSAT